MDMQTTAERNVTQTDAERKKVKIYNESGTRNYGNNQ